MPIRTAFDTLLRERSSQLFTAVRAGRRIGITKIWMRPFFMNDPQFRLTKRATCRFADRFNCPHGVHPL